MLNRWHAALLALALISGPGLVACGSESSDTGDDETDDTGEGAGDGGAEGSEGGLEGGEGLGGEGGEGQPEGTDGGVEGVLEGGEGEPAEGAEEGTEEGAEEGAPEGAEGEIAEEGDPIRELKAESNKVVRAAAVQDRVDVVFDEWGIPHVYASNSPDTAFAIGYLHGRDRLFQVLGFRGFAEGRLSELIGSDTLDTDVDQRRWNFRDQAQQIWDAAPEDIRAVLQAYADGVNAWLEDMQLQDQPFEMAALGIAKEDIAPWDPVDTLAFGRLQTFVLSYGPDDMEIAAVYTKAEQAFAGTDREGIVQDAFIAPPASSAFAVDTYEDVIGRLDGPGATVTAFQRKPRLVANLALIEKAHAARKAIKQNLRPVFGDISFAGSNNWTVGPELNESGVATLCNDPHLGLTNPPIWYELHTNTKLRGGTLNSLGVGFPGAPGVVLGHNERIAWGGTVVAADVTDFYAEELVDDGSEAGAVKFNGEDIPIRVREERIPYRKAAKFKDKPCDAPENIDPNRIARHGATIEEDAERCYFVVKYEEVPHHGPILARDGGSAISVRWTGFDPSDEVGAFFAVNEAGNWDEFRAALESFGVGAQNFVYADVEGNVGYYAHACYPIRAELSYEHPPWMPYPGTGEFEWQGCLPNDKVPQAFNPKSGYIATANQDPFGTSIDGDFLNEAVAGDVPYMSFLFANGYREERIQSRIENRDGSRAPGTKMSRADHEATQADHIMLLAQDTVPALLEAFDAVNDAKEGEPLKAYATAQVAEAEKYLRKWKFRGASGVGATASDLDVPDDERDESIASAIWHAWIGNFVRYTLDDELNVAGISGIPEGETSYANAIVHLLKRKHLVHMAKGADGYAIAFDDMGTPDATETMADIAMRALADALEGLAQPRNADGIGGFGTDDMTQWRWGLLHTLTLEHLAGDPTLAIPKGADRADFPHGFPRHGGHDVPDASGMGFRLFTKAKPSSFTFDGGPSQRFLAEMREGAVYSQTAIPGGQVSNLVSPHYDDQMKQLWLKNMAHEQYLYEEDVVKNATAKVVFIKE